MKFIIVTGWYSSRRSNNVATPASEGAYAFEGKSLLSAKRNAKAKCDEVDPCMFIYCGETLKLLSYKHPNENCWNDTAGNSLKFKEIQEKMMANEQVLEKFGIKKSVDVIEQDQITDEKKLEQEVSAAVAEVIEKVTGEKVSTSKHIDHLYIKNCFTQVQCKEVISKLRDINIKASYTDYGVIRVLIAPFMSNANNELKKRLDSNPDLVLIYHNLNCEWEECDKSKLNHNPNEFVSFFISHKKHRDICLKYLNDDAQVEYFYGEDDWRKVSHDSFFASAEDELRIKPKESEMSSMLGKTFLRGKTEYKVFSFDEYGEELKAIRKQCQETGKYPGIFYARPVLKNGKQSKVCKSFLIFKDSGNAIPYL